MDRVYDGMTQAMWQMILDFWPVWMVLALAVVFSIVLRVYRDRRLARSGIFDIDRMTGTLFEQYLATLFRHLGYKVEQTVKTGATDRRRSQTCKCKNL